MPQSNNAFWLVQNYTAWRQERRSDGRYVNYASRTHAVVSMMISKMFETITSASDSFSTMALYKSIYVLINTKLRYYSFNQTILKPD